MSDARNLDWSAARARVAEAKRALDMAQDPQSGDWDALLRERARSLAMRRAAPTRAEAPLRVLSMSAGAERYGLDITRLAGVIRLGGFAAAPHGPAPLLGFATARGRLWGVFDFAALLGTAAIHSPPGYLVLLRHPSRRVGLRFDAPDRVESVVRVGIGPPPVGRAGAEDGIISGVAPGALILADIDAVWSHPAIAEAN